MSVPPKAKLDRLPSQETLRTLLTFNPETGQLIWNPRPGLAFWNSRCAGKPALTSVDGSGYFQGSVQGISCKAHRVIWKLLYGTEPEEVDHIDGSHTNNTPENLKAVTKSENQRNQRKPRNNTSGVIGVCFDKTRGKWQALIRIRGKQIRLGYFNTKDAAASARKLAEKQHGYHQNHGRAF